MVATTLVLSCIAPKKAKTLSISGYGSESAGTTADGSPFDGSGYTCACSPIFPMHSLVEVCLDGCTTVFVNDATPYPDAFDISEQAARDIGLWNGVGRCFVGETCSVELVA